MRRKLLVATGMPRVGSSLWLATKARRSRCLGGGKEAPIQLRRGFAASASDAFGSTASRMAGIGVNVFAEFSQLALEHNAANLGQGFPNYPMPEFVKRAAVDAITTNANQYTRPGGTPDVLSVLARIYSPLFNRCLSPLENIYTAQGAQMVIVHVFMAFLEAGDEVVVIEPFFDSYSTAAKLVGAKVVGVPMRRDGSKSSSDSAAWYVEPKDLESAMTPKTKLVIFNTPHNPVGKVTSEAEQEELAKVIRKHPSALVLSDEVYEQVTFDGKTHHRLANLAGMWERTITAYSAGKTFSCTGWRLGYAVAPAHLIAPLAKCQQSTAFCAATPLEAAVGRAFDEAESNGYYEELRQDSTAKRDVMVEALRRAGLDPIVPEGGYFVLADTTSLPIPASTATPETPLTERRDFEVARWLTVQAGVTGIPPSAFYTPQNRHMADNLLRFCFVKDDATLELARDRLMKLPAIAANGGG